MHFFSKIFQALGFVCLRYIFSLFMSIFFQQVYGHIFFRNFHRHFTTFLGWRANIFFKSSRARAHSNFCTVTFAELFKSTSLSFLGKKNCRVLPILPNPVWEDYPPRLGELKVDPTCSINFRVCSAEVYLNIFKN